MAEKLDLDALEQAAKAALGWDVAHAWPTDEDGVWEVGHESDDGQQYEVARIDTANYFQPSAAEPLARFFAMANPEIVGALVARIRELERASQTGSGEDIDERAAFEAEHDALPMAKHPEFEYYLDRFTQAYWEGWQARAAMGGKE